MTNDDNSQAQEAQATNGDREQNLLQQLAQLLARPVSPKRNEPTKQLGPLAEYDGNREQLEPWIAQANAKLTVDYANCTETTKFFALHNRLRGEAARQLQPWIQAVSVTDTATSANLITQLRLSFGDPHVKEKAQRKLHQLRQANKSFVEYFTEYRKLLLEAGGTHWPDEIKKSYLEAGLSRELQQQMIGLTKPEQSFEDYCIELKRVGDQLEAFQLRNQRFKDRPQKTAQGWPRRTTTEPITRPKSPQADKMDWEPTGPAKAASTRRAKWVTQEEVSRRYQEHLCIRCGGSGHFKPSCPYAPARRPAQAAAARQPKEVPPQLEEDQMGEVSEESGKE